MKKNFGIGKSKDEIGLFRTAISGGMAGLTLWTVLFPVDVIKSRQQVRNFFEYIVQKILQILRICTHVSLFLRYLELQSP